MCIKLGEGKSIMEEKKLKIALDFLTLFILFKDRRNNLPLLAPQIDLLHHILN